MNFKDPSQAVLASLIISFTLFALLLHQIQPEWVMVIDRLGTSVISLRLLVYFSITFSLVVSTAVLLIVSDRRNNLGNNLDNSYTKGSSSTSFIPTIYQFCD